MNLLDQADPDLLKKFSNFHLNNPHVYTLFKRLAFKMRSTGKKSYSGWIIANVLRWEMDIKTTGDNFIINNDFIALYVRLLIQEHPEFYSFFELRSMKPFDRRMSGEDKYRQSTSKDAIKIQEFEEFLKGL